MSVVATTALAKRFGKQRAVDGIDLDVPEGSIYGFLGPNGSGKTTTIRMLLGLIRADSGEIRVFDKLMPKAAQSVLPRVGALVEGPAFYPYLTGTANLTRLQAVDATSDPRAARRQVAAAIEVVGLTNAAKKKYRHYSLGMKQRLGIAAALMRRRDLVVLDEPMNGLDPQGTREIRELIRELHRAGVTVLVSSHLLSEVEQVCTHIGVMSRGKLVRQAPLAELHSESETRVTITPTEATTVLATQVLTGLGLDPAAGPDGTLVTPLAARPPQEVSAALVHAGVDLVGFTVTHRDLEDLFVELTGAGFDVAQ